MFRTFFNRFITFFAIFLHLNAIRSKPFSGTIQCNGEVSTIQFILFLGKLFLQIHNTKCALLNGCKDTKGLTCDSFCSIPVFYVHMTTFSLQNITHDVQLNKFIVRIRCNPLSTRTHQAVVVLFVF